MFVFTLDLPSAVCIVLSVLSVLVLVWDLVVQVRKK